MPNHVPTAAGDPCVGVPGACVEAFASGLRELGFSALTVRRKRSAAASFARWTAPRALDVRRIDEAAVHRFLKQTARGPEPTAFRRHALAQLLEHLRASGQTIRPEPPRERSPAAHLCERYESYLRVERGVAEATVLAYRRFVSDFLRAHLEGLSSATPASSLSAQDVRDFLLRRTRGWAPRTAQSLATVLRSFLRFLFLRGETAVDLAPAVPPVRAWRQATVHPYLRPEEVESLLAACDVTTPCGRRDHAILLLLARLGLRGCEVVALELDDVRWRSGEVLVRGKGQVLECLPLLPDVGAALAFYLRDGRPRSPSRRVFLRNDPPRVGLHRGSVGAIVARALARAGLRPPRRGSHLLRFSLATTLIRRGATLTEIGQVLRHRSRDSTEIYAKVDFETLRAVALPWPGAGGAR